MADIETFALSQLPTAERTELEAVLQGNPAYLADNNDIVALWLFLLIAGCGAVGAYFFGGIPYLFPFSREVALLAAIGLLAWTIQTWVRTYGRRGCAFTRFGTFRVRGTRLTGIRHANVAQIKCRTLGRRGKRFTVFELVGNDQKKLTMYAHAPWATAAIAAIQRVRGGKIPVAEY